MNINQGSKVKQAVNPQIPGPGEKKSKTAKQNRGPLTQKTAEGSSHGGVVATSKASKLQDALNIQTQ